MILWAEVVTQLLICPLMFISYLRSEHPRKLLQPPLEEQECIYPIQMVWVGVGEISENLAPVSRTIHHPLLVFLLLFFQLSVCLSPALCAFLQAWLVKEAFEIPPEEISPCRFSFMNCGTGRCHREERVCWILRLLLFSFLLQSSSMSIFIKGYRVNKIPDLAQS